MAETLDFILFLYVFHEYFYFYVLLYPCTFSFWRHFFIKPFSFIFPIKNCKLIPSDPCPIKKLWSVRTSAYTKVLIGSCVAWKLAGEHDVWGNSLPENCMWTLDLDLFFSFCFLYYYQINFIKLSYLPSSHKFFQCSQQLCSLPGIISCDSFID